MFNIRLGTDSDKELLKAQYPHTIPVLDDGGYLIVAEQNNIIVGFLWAFKRKIPAPIEQEELFINVIEVFPEELRCQGVASRMLNKVREIAMEEKFYQLRAYCDIRNISSHRLWAKNGYSINPVASPEGAIVGSYVSLVITD